MRRASLVLILLVLLPAAAAGQPSLRKVVVDAGHGGSDTGAVSPFGPQEKDVALDLARRVADSLRARGYEVEMTRGEDVFVTLNDRAGMANRAATDLFVSIHANASPSPALRGFEVYYLSESADDMALAQERSGGKMLETVLWDLRQTENRRESLKLARHITGTVKDARAVPVQRVRDANFQVLRKSEMPAVLVEAGYLTHRQDERSLRSVIHRARLAEAIAGGIDKFKQEIEMTNGFTQ